MYRRTIPTDKITYTGANIGFQAVEALIDFALKLSSMVSIVVVVIEINGGVEFPSQLLRGYNADFDGDEMQCYFVTTPNAVREAKSVTSSSSVTFKNRLLNTKRGTGGIERQQDLKDGFIYRTTMNYDKIIHNPVNSEANQAADIGVERCSLFCDRCFMLPPEDDEISNSVVSHTNSSIEEKSSSQSSVGYVSRISKCTAIRIYSSKIYRPLSYGIPHLRIISKLSASLMQVHLTKETLDPRVQGNDISTKKSGGRECSPKSEILLGAANTLVLLKTINTSCSSKETIQKYKPVVILNEVSKSSFVFLYKGTGNKRVCLFIHLPPL